MIPDLIMGRKFGLEINSQDFNIRKIEMGLDNGVDLIFVSELRSFHQKVLGQWLSKRFQIEQGARQGFLFICEVPLTRFGCRRSHDLDAFDDTVCQHLNNLSSELGIGHFDGVLIDEAGRLDYEKKHGQSLVVEEILSQLNATMTDDSGLKCIGFKNCQDWFLHKALCSHNRLPMYVINTESNGSIRDLCVAAHIPVFDYIVDTPEDWGNAQILAAAGITDTTRWLVNTLEYGVPAGVAYAAPCVNVEVPDRYSFQPRSVPYSDPNVHAKIEACLISGAGYVIVKSAFSEHLTAFDQCNIESNEGRWLGVSGTASEFLSNLAFCQAVSNPIVMTIVEYVLGWDSLIDNVAFSISQPDNEAFGPHIDSPYDRNPGSKILPGTSPLSLQCIYCVDDFTADNGAFYLYPGTQNQITHLTVYNQEWLTEMTEDQNKIVVEARAGDVIIALGNVWHGAEKNHSTVARRGLLAQHVSSIVSPRDDVDLTLVADEVLQKYPLTLIEKLYRNRRKERDFEVVKERWREGVS